MPYSLHNKFGSGDIYQAGNLFGYTFIVSSGCLPVHTEALGWANSNTFNVTREPFAASNIIVQGCQRNDLAILNSIKLLEYYKKEFLGKKIYITGCLAKRFDIKLPEGVRRLSTLRRDRQLIKDKSLIKREKMFLGWEQLFGSYYPLRIGVGGSRQTGPCQGHTLRPGKKLLDGDFRRKTKCIEEADYSKKPIVLVSDRPTAEQISNWCRTSIFESRDIAIYNAEVEELVNPEVENSLIVAAKARTLKGLHCQLRTASAEILKDYGMNVSKVHRLLMLVEKLKKYQVFCAADVVIDYKWVKDTSIVKINNLFDAVRWEPFWDGKWIREKAQARSNLYNHADFDWINR